MNFLTQEQLDLLETESAMQALVPLLTAGFAIVLVLLGYLVGTVLEAAL